jgi:hypothetical protein
MEQLPTTAWMPPLKGGPSQRGLWVDKGTTPRMGEVDRVGSQRSRATQGAVAEQTANSQIMAYCLSANPPYDLLHPWLRYPPHFIACRAVIGAKHQFTAEHR